MPDLSRTVRKIERALGVPVIIKSAAAWIDDSKQSGHTFRRELGSPSMQISNLKALHEQVYHQRGRAKHVIQGGVCAQCGRKLGEYGEVDHIKPRGTNGRDDRMPNLQVVCSTMMPGGCRFHAKKHGG
jgi:hypothetical protein